MTIDTDVAVVGLPDYTWGQRIAVVIITQEGAPVLTVDTLRKWCQDRIPPYCIPTVVRVLDSMPRNAMGKVNKKDLVKTVFAKESKIVL